MCVCVCGVWCVVCGVSCVWCVLCIVCGVCVVWRSPAAETVRPLRRLFARHSPFVVSCSFCQRSAIGWPLGQSGTCTLSLNSLIPFDVRSAFQPNRFIPSLSVGGACISCVHASLRVPPRFAAAVGCGIGCPIATNLYCPAQSWEVWHHLPRRLACRLSSARVFLMLSSRRRLRLIDSANVRRAVGSGCQIVGLQCFACFTARHQFGA